MDLLEHIRQRDRQLSDALAVIVTRGDAKVLAAMGPSWTSRSDRRARSSPAQGVGGQTCGAPVRSFAGQTEPVIALHTWPWRWPRSGGHSVEAPSQRSLRSQNELA
jgi:hypothetical protein